MARFGFRGGFKGRSSFSGGRRARGKRSGARVPTSGRRSGAKSGARHKASSGVAKVYSIYDSKGRRTYVGSTNNPQRRADQHRKSGKLSKGGKLVVESKSMSRKGAERLEAKKIQGYKRRTGRLPEHNKTADGQYHHRKFN